MLEAIEGEQVSEAHGRAVLRHARLHDRIIGEAGQLSLLAGGEVELRQVKRPALPADEIEAMTVRLPQRPHAATVVVEDLAIVPGGEIVKPDLAGLRAVITLAPPGGA